MASRPDINPNDTLLIYIVGRVDQGIRQEMRLRLAEWDLSVPEFTALAVLKRRPGLSNAQLARRVRWVRPQSMNEILVKLEDRGAAAAAKPTRITRGSCARR